MTLTPEYLLNTGWIFKVDAYWRYSNPRMGWKPDGTFYLGYHTYPEKVTTIEQLTKIIEENG